MKKTLLILLMLFGITAFSQKQVFAVSDIKEKIARQKIVAILPFPTTIIYKKQPKNFSAEANQAQELKMAKNIQSSMYTFLLRKQERYSVKFQDIDKTNILLKKAGIEDNLDSMTKDEIAKILGVDAVISGKFEQQQSKTEAGAIASAIIFGGVGGKTGSSTLTLTINDANDGELLWRFMKTMDDSITYSPDDVVESMMRKVSRNFPYEK